MSELYDTDILLWSEQQGELLRRLAAGERVNHRVDWQNVVEEVESVGRSQLSAVQSFLVQALVHELKAQGWPSAPDVEGWLAEARRFRGDAAEAFVPSMRQRIDMDRVYQRALQALPKVLDGRPPLPLPMSCPVTLDEMLNDK
jgi:hypothetical protein